MRVLDEGVEDDEDQEFEYRSTHSVVIPPLFAQEGNKEQGWNAKNVEAFLVLLLNSWEQEKVGQFRFRTKPTNQPGFPTK